MISSLATIFFPTWWWLLLLRTDITVSFYTLAPFCTCTVWIADTRCAFKEMKNGCLLNTENKHIQQDKPKAKYCFCMCYDYRMPFFIFYYCSERESYHNGIGKDTGGTVETQQNKEQKRKKKLKFIEAHKQNIYHC